MFSESDYDSDKVLKEFDRNYDSIDIFCKTVVVFFESGLLKNVVHSVRYRIKEKKHLLDKISRKNSFDKSKDVDYQNGVINENNFMERITDLAGVRVLHLHQKQFIQIHNAIMGKVDDEEFYLFEKPKAYTWDPDSDKFFCSLGIETYQKDSFYTSIHYVLKPNKKSRVTCEVQIRTLLEEVWGEIDHTMNYPTPVNDEQCVENIKVLARLISAGSHLADSIMRKYAKR